MHFRPYIKLKSKVAIFVYAKTSIAIYANVAADLIRTPNAIEGWHNGVMSLFQGSHVQYSENNQRYHQSNQ